MKKSYYSKHLLSCLLTLALMAAGTITGFAQTTVYISPIGADEFFPPAKNIAPGSDNNIIAVFGAYINGAATVNSVTVTTAGTYTVDDIKSNGFKLWFAPSNSANPSDIEHATLISTKAPLASGNTLVFSGLSQNLDVMGSYFYITADVAEDATLDKTLHLTATPLSNIVIASGEVMGEELPATAVQTIGMPLPEISIYYGYNTDDNKISPGSTKNRLYEFSLNITEANDVLQSLTIPVRGTVTTADVAPNGFRLWHRTYFGNYQEVLAGTASLTENGNVVFSDINVPLNRDPSGYGGHGFTLTVDLAAGATAGRTIGVAEFPLSNFTFQRARNVRGQDPLIEGNLNTIAVPAIAIGSLNTAAGVVSPGSVNSELYKLRIEASNAGAAFSSIRFTTSGTYQQSDIARFKLMAGDEDEFENDELIATTGSVAPGSEVIFNLTDATLRENDDVVLYLVADIASGAVAGRTIQIQAVTPANITAFSGTVTGATTAGGVQTIAIPSVVFTPAGPPAGITSPGSFVVLHTVRVDVTNAPATLQSADFQLSGTYQPSDLGDSYDSDGDGIDDTMEGFYLVYHKTASLLSEINSDDEDFYLLSMTEEIPGAGETLTFGFVEDDDDFNPTIPLGTGYITVVASVRETAVLGRTIQVSSSGTAAYSLVSGIKSGTTGTGGVQTIGAPAINISTVATPAGNISIGSPEVVLYKIKIDAADATAILKDIRLTTGGTYEQNDVYSFGLYHSSDAVFDPRVDYQVGHAQSVTGGSTLEFDNLDFLQILPGSSSYLILVAHTSVSATAGRTINIAATPASAFTFLAGNPDGTFPLPAGGMQTFIAPTLNVTVPALAQKNLPGGTKNNVVHRFNVTASGADAYGEYLMVRAHGTFESYDLAGEGLQVWFNTSDSFSGSRLVGWMGTMGSGGSIGTSMGDASIKAGTTGYFFITADIASTAVAGHTLQLELEELSFSGMQVSLPDNARSAEHTIGQAAAVPVIAVNFPALTASNLQAGTADNVIYRFNVMATDANAHLNFIKFYTGGSYRSSDLAANGLKLWYNTTNSFDGSTLVHAFESVGGEGGSVSAGLENIQINAGSTGYFFITASVSPSAVSNRTVRVSQLDFLQFASGNVQLSDSRGATFTIGTPLDITLDTDNNGTHVYPNPYRQQETLNIQTNSAHPKLVTIYSATGTVVRSVQMTETTQLVLSNLSKGLYLIQVQHLKDNKVEVKKLLVQ